MSITRDAGSAIHFLVNTDCNKVFENREKIERMFSVTLLLDIPAPTNRYNWVGVRGDPRDRHNARSYILSLVKAPDSIYTIEKTIYLPPEVSDDVIETVERRITAAIIPFKDDIFHVRGSTLSVNAAMTELEEIVDKALEPDIIHSTPARPNHASRRLSCALQETLNKTNLRGNYANAPDAVKRAIASFLMEKTEDDETTDDDVILIEDDHDDTVEPILIEDDSSDDDVMIIETPRKTNASTEENGNLFIAEDRNSKNSQAVEQLTKAFSDMKTPSKSSSKPKVQKNVTKAVVKPLNFNKVNKDKTTIASNEPMFQTEESASQIENVVTTETLGKKKTKRKKKRTASKLIDDINTEVIIIHDDPPALLRKGQMFIEDNKDNENDSKRRKLKSAITQPNKISEKQTKNGTDTVQTHNQSKKGEKEGGSLKRQDIYSDTVENYLKEITKDTVKAKVSSEKKILDNDMNKFSFKKKVSVYGGDRELEENTAVARSQTSRSSDHLRYIIIDGSNVAMAHGQDGVFSCKGLRICVDYFRSRGHQMITIFLPHWRKCRPSNPSSVTYRYVLDDLEKEGYLVYTPSRRIGNKLVASYDDRYVIELAEREDGVVVSNDQYRDLLHEKYSWRRVIETRLLMYTFVRDHFMPPEDPYGRNGPSLSELLRHPRARPAVSTVSLGQDMYTRLKCLEAGNPRSDKREAEQDFYSNRTARY
ncbi:probable ribonuclease ZC3H12C [Mercenaria mercenaria]|uniref:probable ribonuclease ZC3H12C n=1 Tax=Mercenaria mercenaria TaxID=6596 RepID=UPI00234F3B4B|nr:probable ribonuclease ZC3H12C [Mercenaria mercenaria]